MDVFALTASYIVYSLKLHCHYVSLSKLYKRNVHMWIVPLLLYSKVKANIYILKILKSLLEFQIQDFQQFTDVCMLY